MNDIGETLRLARESTGVSIEEVSKDLDIKEEILENIESGKTGAFKDVFELKEYIVNYTKYLGLDTNKMIDEFNEYMFEYTSKIPIKEIEKTIELQIKEINKTEKVASPYTKKAKKYSNTVYIAIYALVFLMIFVAIFWSIKQITIDKKISTTISYRK
ncbi:MAG: helix-turn-helix domain-containing protein [Bacilli bacterium]